MKKILLIITILLTTLCTVVAQCDTTIRNSVLISHFSYKYHNPLYVTYKLYKGGGDCNRSQFSFKTDDIKNSPTKKDYVGSGLDIGHLCPAEDFSYDCELEKQTFYFYNAIPQYPNLNRGIWKTFENNIRDDSQHDSLLVICGGIYNKIKIEGSEVSIPTHCWKVVKSLTTGKIMYCLLFTNQKEKNSVKHITIIQLEKLIGYKLHL